MQIMGVGNYTRIVRRERERERERERGRQTDRQTGRHRGRKRQREKQRKTCKTGLLLRTGGQGHPMPIHTPTPTHNYLDHFLVACYATLQPASVRRSVRLSVRPSVGLSIRHTLLFFCFCGLWPHCSCPNDWVTSNTAPAHPHATGVAVYLALFSTRTDRKTNRLMEGLTDKASYRVRSWNERETVPPGCTIIT